MWLNRNQKRRSPDRARRTGPAVAAVAAVALAAALVWMPVNALPVWAAARTEAAGGSESTQTSTTEAPTTPAQANGPSDSAQTPNPDSAPSTPASPASPTGIPGAPAATGTAVLMGAGVYTVARKRWSDRKKSQERPQEYIYFENHTKTGTLRDEEKFID